MINSESIANEGRGQAPELCRKEIVNAGDIISALDAGKMSSCVTDFRRPK